MEAKQDLGPGLNWKQAIKRLGCSKSMFYKLVDAGAFPNAYRLGRCKGVRVPLADVDFFLKKTRLE